MKKQGIILHWGVVFVILLLLLCTGCSEKKPEKKPGLTDEQIITEFDRLTEAVITEEKVPGIIVGIWAPDRQLTWVMAKGLADISSGQPMLPANTVRIGSNTKTFTVTVLLQLVDEGNIHLDDTLNKFSPDFPNAKEITIRQLCNMRSGIYNYSEAEEFGKELEENPQKKHSPQSLVKIAADRPAYFPPSTSYHYSNTNTILIGMIIEKLTGNKLETEFQKRIFRPLMMENTTFTDDRHMTGDFSHGYGEDGNLPASEQMNDVTEKYDFSWAWAAGAMISNLEDMKIWAKALSEGTLLSKATQKERLTFMEIPAGAGYPKMSAKYGLGLFEMGGFIGHNGSCFGYRSAALHSPGKNTTIVIFYNAQSKSDPIILFQKISKTLYPDLPW